MHPRFSVKSPIKIITAEHTGAVIVRALVFLSQLTMAPENLSIVTIITPLVKAALSLYQATYGSTVDTFVDIYLKNEASRSFLKVKSERRFWRILPWRVELLLVLIPTWLTCVYLILDRIFVETKIPITFKSTQHLNLIHIILFAFFVVALSSYFKCCWIIRRHPESISAINHCFKHMLEKLLPLVGDREQRILQRFPNSFYKYLTDVALFGFTFTIVFLSFPIPFVACFLELDPYRILMKKFILPHPFYYTFDEIIWPKIVSITLTGVLFFEVARVFTIFLFLLLLLGQQVFLCLFVLELVSTWYEKFTLIYYESARILLATVSPFFGIVQVVIFYAIALSCFTAWLVLVGNQELPAFCLFFVSMIFVACIVLVQLSLKWATNCALRSAHVVRMKLKNGDFGLSRNARYFNKKWKAQPTLYIKCGSQFHISNASAMAYMDVVICNVTNAVLLIRPQG